MTLTDDGLLAGYAPREGTADELLDDRARLREPWTGVGPALEAMGTSELRSRQRDVARLLDADGASYRIVDSGRSQPWKLDAIPLLMSSADWAGIEESIRQRAALLDLVLRDLYGERKLLSRGVIPPELVFDDPGFVPAWDRQSLPDGSQLFTYAVDLARDGDGEFRALADFTQAPSGAGYALQNRLVLSRVFPSLYRNARVHHVAPFFRSFRAGLQSLGAHRSDDPRIVILSPGPLAETAFEHAQLGSYLGYSVVEGRDLVVRDGEVQLRALGQLEPVDVVLRRVDAAFADPLELRPDSQLGVPGLVEAARRRSVAVANPVGSGVVENPALHAFLPAAAQALLGQELRMPGVETWWCGDPDAKRFVLEHLDQLVCKPIARTGAARTLFGDSLTRDERRRLAQRIEDEPRRWVAQRPLPMSTTPTLTSQGVVPRRTLLRAFAVARHRSWAVMPGGLARVAPGPGNPLISNQLGALAKDVWVLASEPQDPAELWLRSGPTPASLDGLTQRAAENLFWMGRYLERAESTARLLRAVQDRRTDQSSDDATGAAAVAALLRAITLMTFTEPGFVGPGAEARIADPDHELLSLICNDRRAGSVANSVRRLLTSAEAVRDQLSLDTWQFTSDLENHLDTLAAASPNRQEVVQGTLGSVLASLLSLQGIVAESMVRDAGWHFLDAGRRIERFLQLARMLQSTLYTERDDAVDSLVLESILISAESIITYRRRYRSRAQVATVLDLLIADGGNPRSLRYQVDRLVDAVAALPGNASQPPLGREERSVLRLQTEVRLVQTEALAAGDGAGCRAALEAFCSEVIALADEVAAAVDERSFAHLPPQRPLVDLGVRTS